MVNHDAHLQAARASGYPIGLCVPGSIVVCGWEGNGIKGWLQKQWFYLGLAGVLVLGYVWVGPGFWLGERSGLLVAALMFVMGLGLFALMAMLYWSSLLIEQDLKQLRGDFVELKSTRPII